MHADITPILEVKDLKVSFRQQNTSVNAVDGLSFAIRPGQIMALVGESGCGKSTMALSILRLLPSNSEISGSVELEGKNLMALSSRDLRKIRGNEIAMIFQEPMTSLNPVHRIGHQISESIRHHENKSSDEARSKALELLKLVHLPDPERRLDEYPHQLSGGQRQRVMIAMAIAGNPKLLIADEPTTALDATIQAEILELLDELRTKLDMAILLITHDLAVVARWAHDVVVMHHGQKMEELPAAALFEKGQHPYTKGLIGASIRLDQDCHYRTDSLSEIRVSKNATDDYTFDLEKPNRPQFADAIASETVLDARNLVTVYNTSKGEFTAVDDVSLTIARGETVGLVGESGSGKSTLSKTIMRLVPAKSGAIRLKGNDITSVEGRKLRSARADMQMIFQDPFSSLNPRHSIESILDVPLRLNGIKSSVERRKRIANVLDSVGLPTHSVHRYPHEFSGGQRQRIGIARAIILRPSLVVCDEAVSALDVSVQSQILNLLADLKQEYQLSYLFISHDLAVVQYISDRIVVMKDAKIVEESDHIQILKNPQHEYTRSLINAARVMH